MEVGFTVYDEIAETVAAHFAEGWGVAGYDFPDIAPEIPSVTFFPGGHDSFIVPEGFGVERVSASLSVWLPSDDERQALRQFYAMCASFNGLARSFTVGAAVSGVELVRVLEPRIVTAHGERSAFVGQFDVAFSVSTC